MKIHFHKIALNSAILVLSSTTILASAQAAEHKSQLSVSSIPTEQGSLLKKRKLLAEQSQQIINEAQDALMGTQHAMLELERNDAASALVHLQEVSKKLETIAKNNPTLVLVTADVEVDIIDFKGNAKAIEQKVKQAAELLSHGKLQAGRMVADELASEIDITTVNIPLTTYPQAIKLAIADVTAGKVVEASQVLEQALTTLVEHIEILPLPLLGAESLIIKASELEQQTDLSKEKNRDEVLKLVDAAKEQLKIAEVLGYGNKDDYQPFYKVIADLKDTVHTEKSQATWAKINQAFTDLKNKITPSKK